MIKIVYKNILETVGNTPIVKISNNKFPQLNIFAKLEMYNPTGSVKDRAAKYIIDNGIKSGELNEKSIIIESSSGNFGIALSAYCKFKGLAFYCVIDPLITPINEFLIRINSTKVFKVDKRDENGAYLLNRIRQVNKLLKEIPNAFWVNQYANPNNATAYAETLGEEICREMEVVDYLFVGVSSGGTITGLSNKIKTKFPNVKIIAVDIKDSVIFGGVPEKRFIPGIGSSKVPDILLNAKIDDVVMVDECSVIQECQELLTHDNLFVGGSSGAVIAGIKQYFAKQKDFSDVNIVTIFADRGDRYANTIYNESWKREVGLLG